MSKQNKTDQSQVQSLFSDLGRATRRGVRNCPKCGTLNGTRGRVCKNTTCDVIFRVGRIREIITDPCKKLTLSDSDSFQVFSVRIRDKGPDYRNFVLLPQPTEANIRRSQESDPLETIDILPQCYVETCLRNPNVQCRHIKAAQVCYSGAEVLVIKHNILSSINIPSDTKHALFMMLNQAQEDFVQRCSKTTFAVKCETTPKHPLGFLHVLFFKGNREDGSTELKFFCGCRPVTNRRSNARAFNPMAGEPQNKYCYHFYACICAFASCGPLISEFEYFVAQAISQTYSATLLTGLHLVPILDEDEANVEEMNSKYAMRENLSLLESIASDEAAHKQGQMEGVLSDQVEVTNVGVGDDPLGFGDPSALEVLDETDPQVSSHLTHISEILSHSSQNQQVVCQIFRAPDRQYAGSLTSEFTQVEDSSYQGITRQIPQTHFKKFREADAGNTSASSADSDVPTIVSVSSASGTTILAENGAVGGTDRYHVLTKHHPVSIRPKNYSSNARLPTRSVIESNDEMERRMNSANFERWIAGVNERMNGAMHFEFGEPDPLVYFLPLEQFEFLKDRIISGSRTKRASSPSISIALRDKPPTGAFSKYVWKITNIIHVIHIFQSTQVPLKLTQFFMRTSTGSYAEWIHPWPTCTSNEVTIPELHCSTLKVGKLEPGVKESTPLIIEWIPNVLPESKMGELTLHFQVMRTGPIYTDEEIRACNSPIQRMIQQSHTFALR